MPKPETYSVANWSEYQHYKKRRPPWIKFYVALLDSYDYGELSNDAQLLHVQLLLLAAKTDNKIPMDARWIAKKIPARFPLVKIDELLQELIQQGFGRASNLLASCASNTLASDRDRDREETETKAETEAEETREAAVTVQDSEAEPDHRAFDSLDLPEESPSPFFEAGGWATPGMRESLAKAGHSLADGFRVSRGTIQSWWTAQQGKRKHARAVLDAMEAAARAGPETIRNPIAWLNRAVDAKSQAANATDNEQQATRQKEDTAAAAALLFGTSGRGPG